MLGQRTGLRTLGRWFVLGCRCNRGGRNPALQALAIDLDFDLYPTVLQGHDLGSSPGAQRPSPLLVDLQLNVLVANDHFRANLQLVGTRQGDGCLLGKWCCVGNRCCQREPP